MLVAIGDNPYNAGSRTREEENGLWRVDADTIERALERMFSSMQFPGAAVGRYLSVFIPEVSLPFPEDEVIQVWTHDAQAIERLRRVMDRFEKRRDYYVPHDGNGNHMGVVREVHVKELAKYVKPVRKLLAPVAGETKTISPLGASLISIDERRHEIQQSMLMNKYAVDLKRRDMELLTDQMKEQQQKLERGLGLLNMYLHGADMHVTICEGDPAPSAERWHVFQNRQYLDKEIGVLANFKDFDFQNVEALDKWLVDSGRIWKFLPFPKCILATRIREDRKEYNDRFCNAYWNALNFQNILWIRNGGTVVRVNVEHHFENAVFPDQDIEKKLISAVEDKIWKDHFSTRRFDRWSSNDKGVEEKQEPLGFKKNADSEETPYVLARIVMRRFKTVEAWKSSKEFHDLEPQMRQKIFDYIREKNQQQMSFLMLLQGIIDRTTLLDVPPGSDLFQSEVCNRYFELVYDYSHGLPDHTYAKLMRNHMANVKKGDWVIVPHLMTPKGGLFGHKPTLYYVYNVINGEPYVKYHPMSRRRIVLPGERIWDAERRPVKEGRPTRLGNVPFLRVDLNVKLAEQILDDREWKMENKWVVPILANWRSIQKKYLGHPVNGTVIDIEEPHD